MWQFGNSGWFYTMPMAQNETFVMLTFWFSLEWAGVNDVMKCDIYCMNLTTMWCTEYNWVMCTSLWWRRWSLVLSTLAPWSPLPQLQIHPTLDTTQHYTGTSHLASPSNFCLKMVNYTTHSHRPRRNHAYLVFWSLLLIGSFIYKTYSTLFW